jgi:hypothetical protein
LNGRDGKTALELTFGIILTLDVYAKANEQMRELVAWTPVAQPLAIALNRVKWEEITQ